MKWCWAAVVLKALAQYRQAQTDGDLDHAFQGLLNVHMVGSVVVQRHTSRWPEGIQESRILRAWYGARLTRVPSIAEMRACLRIGVGAREWNENDCSWRPSEALMRRYAEIPGLWGFKAGRSDFQDDDIDREYRLWCTRDREGNWVPYPFDPRTKPYGEWSWWRLHAWMECRFVRMDEHCNQYWETDTNVQTFQLSLMQAHCCHLQRDQRGLRKARKNDPAIPYRDPIPRDDFGLCASPWRGAPTAASVSHRYYHHLGMNGGYRGVLDLSSPLFVYDDKERNLSLDTRTTNLAVQDFAVELVDDIGRQLDYLRQDGKYWEPGQSRWADPDWVDADSLDPAVCVAVAQRNKTALDKRDDEHDRGSWEGELEDEEQELYEGDDDDEDNEEGIDAMEPEAGDSGSEVESDHVESGGYITSESEGEGPF